jgi:L-aminopeptidase/D-esterase-like protein
VRGSAPGTRETDLLRTGNLVEKLHAVVLAGGSAFGLEAACGVMEYLSERNIGFRAGAHAVPIVPAAVIFDINTDKLVYPDKKTGYEACLNAKEGNYISGRVGAGTGATVGKMAGVPSAGGVGCASVTIGNIVTTAVIVCNAAGDIYDAGDGRVISGARGADGGLIDAYNAALKLGSARMPAGTNTTVGAVITNAALTKEYANKLAAVAHDGLAMSIRPVHTMADGDTIFGLSTGEIADADINLVLLSAVEAVRLAVLGSVTV